uniref:Integrase zinc-binding domain-containing protein n=1 Tax=Chromera velia CCMP2878 TaxID=1169474 RepID=A0A0G4I838_9ALVE|eukprot:Cvel_11770.t1-p1 / transcript=Cvel_11770.t1 / gene=Cvel_11770 / organism=Chromera_velia_CCMP2878 / gene_product=Retrotransposable element Tf2 155 kDa protein type, putative / transcript_product=Retrotransposable element Tf2 155 kDa protein type, putative / location=Cvel_scaffold748:39807-40904(+) / protein_length=366 / sequence_SO=supercontig / SO=protein_coding / is_pseudo=false
MSLPFRVKPDACEVSVGGVLMQMQKGREVVIAYVSRGLSAAEKNYSPTEREALGAVYCCKQWRHYMCRGAAYVITDHKPNLAMSDRKVANKRVHNWALELQEYGLTFVHKAGKEHVDADAVSRQPQPPPSLPVSIDSGVPLCRHYNQPAGGSKEIRSGMAAALASVQAGVSLLQVERGFLDRVREELPRDPSLKDHFKYFAEGVLLQEAKKAKQILLEESAFEKRGGLLYKYKGRGTERKEQLVVPEACRKTVLVMNHNHQLGGHPGVNRLTEKTLLHFWWPGLRADAREWVASCRECRERLKPKVKRVPQTVPVPPHPWHTLGIDVSGPFPTSRRGNRFMLIVIDHFRKDVETFARLELPAHVVA